MAKAGVVVLAAAWCCSSRRSSARSASCRREHVAGGVGAARIEPQHRLRGGVQVADRHDADGVAVLADRAGDARRGGASCRPPTARLRPAGPSSRLRVITPATGRSRTSAPVATRCSRSRSVKMPARRPSSITRHAPTPRCVSSWATASTLASGGLVTRLVCMISATFIVPPATTLEPHCSTASRRRSGRPAVEGVRERRHERRVQIVGRRRCAAAAPSPRRSRARSARRSSPRPSAAAIPACALASMALRTRAASAAWRSSRRRSTRQSGHGRSTGCSTAGPAQIPHTGQANAARRTRSAGTSAPSSSTTHAGA